jgi:hypothetical protein
MNGDPASLLSDTLRWTLESVSDPAMAAADWLARDIDPQQQTVVDLLTRREVTIEQLLQAKEAFKTMRIVGETPADRRVGARLYAATIAAALVHHDQHISAQSAEALRRALRALLDDTSMHAALRALAGTALGKLTGPGPGATSDG